MTRVHADQIEVERGIVGPGGVGPGGVGPGDAGVERIEGPVRFRWGRRSYAVLAVLEHWVEVGNWWRRTGGARTPPHSTTRPVTRPATRPVTRPEAGQRAAVVGIDDGEREVWRVEARQLHAGGDAPVGVFDLNFDWSAGQWSLIRVHD